MVAQPATCPIRPSRRALSVVCFALLVSCSGPVTSPSPTPPGAGGTLRVGIPREGPFPETVERWLDPGFEIIPFFRRCCTARTLVSYNVASPGHSAALEPDLAAELPSVSPDGLTWTFRLRHGLRYAPPFQEVEITAGDFVRSIERSIMREVLFAGFRGIDEFIADPSAGLAGLQTPDDHTLVVSLSQPDGDLPNKLAEPAASPIPAAALGGDRLTEFVSSGPYMIDTVDANGAVLVRNPSWSPSVDPLRPAHVSLIEIVPVADEAEGLRMVEAGTLDLITAFLAPDDYRRALRDGEGNRIVSTQANASFTVPMNVANPPLDDVHVRRAVALLIDRAAIAEGLEAFRGSLFEATDHVIPDIALNGLLSDYDPLAAAGPSGSIAAAQAEMRLSRYDTDQDGRCDHPACARIVIVPYFDTGAAAQRIADQLPGLGMAPDIQRLEGDTQLKPGPYHMVAVLGWVAIGPTPAEHGLLLSSDGIPFANLTLLGASGGELRQWGLDGSVTSLDEEIQFCLEHRGSSALRCWAELDQLVMERLVPTIPIATGFVAFRISDRVAGVEMSPTDISPALDTLRLVDDAAPPS